MKKAVEPAWGYAARSIHIVIPTESVIGEANHREVESLP